MAVGPLSEKCRAKAAVETRTSHVCFKPKPGRPENNFEPLSPPIGYPVASSNITNLNGLVWWMQPLGRSREFHGETGAFAVRAPGGIQCAPKLLSEGVNYSYSQASAGSLRVEPIDQTRTLVADN